MTLYALKPRFQAWLRPLVGIIARAGITANQVTVTAAVVSLVIGACVAWRLPDTRAFVLIPFWMFGRMAFNAIDGMLAREFGQQSRLGAYLNELGDVIADSALFLPFAYIAPFAPAWVGAVIVLAVIGEYAGALGAMVGASRRYEGPMGKSDRALVFGALGLWVGLASPLPAWAAFVMPVLAALLALTIINRVRGGLKESR
ncbi:MAG: CDP-alcohol phosphatidyltransferase family protein [Propionivibrio sp.]|uniref:CDP-alcohol phosphatidyltransferase family protein n=1 Tax=Propionivibrio sp. TaxID=2212460 RepID=UPI001A52C146|nr:CDP-alcohol phosphatidyltransferase family protein [Propionivibrio sp.]MBL8414208.1 CDP-alcohol phosphatidyltransferase family protein [Propionivibrio sp.]